MRPRHFAKAHLAIAIGVIVMIPGAAEADVAQFDLICRGTVLTGKLSEPWLAPDSKSGFTDHYRVDLATKRWCVGDCASTSDLAEVTEQLIVFQRDEDKDVD